MTEQKSGEPATKPLEENLGTPAPQDDGLPEGHKFKGKTAKEIAEAYGDLEGKLGQSAKDYSELKANRDSYQSAYDSILAQQQAAAKVSTQTPEEDVYKTERDIAKEESQKAMNQVRYETALRMAPLALNEAKRLRPDLFEGDKEKKVKEMFMGTIMRGGMNPEFATDPSNWVMAAYNFDGQEKGYKPASTTQSMNPTQTEVPNATKPQMTEEQVEVPWSANAQSMWDKIGSDAFGGKKEDLIKEVQEGMTEEQRLAK